ncbi:hypothetical protein J6590_029758 [Homalodisca vitripennis]|nr:hypothetical protein J6590_029758 [Homalodisca vitripennis]
MSRAHRSVKFQEEKLQPIPQKTFVTFCRVRRYVVVSSTSVVKRGPSEVRVRNGVIRLHRTRGEERLGCLRGSDRPPDLTDIKRGIMGVRRPIAEPFYWPPRDPGLPPHPIALPDKTELKVTTRCDVSHNSELASSDNLGVVNS